MARLQDDRPDRRQPWNILQNAPMVAVGGVILLLGVSFFTYSMFRIEVPAKHVAVLIHKTGKSLPTSMELAPDDGYQGVQLSVLKEGRYFYNPYSWSWKVVPQVEVPEGHVGVLIRQFGDDLAQGRLLAENDKQKGIVSEPLRPGRYPEYSNPFAYQIELHKAVTIPAGYKGVVTLVSGKPSANPNRMLVDAGERGVQSETIDPGTYYINPYEKQIHLVDCRTKKLKLADEKDMGFPSLDGFWIRLDGTVQFRVDAKKASEIYVTYNDANINGDDVEQEIVQKVILPNARSFCRLKGSAYTGRQFIEGQTREEFQRAFEERMKQECQPKGIEIVSALISKIFPPEKIAEPVRKREYFQLQQEQFGQEIMEQRSLAQTTIAKTEIERQSRLKQAEREVIKMRTEAEQDQQVAVTKAEERLAVAKKRLDAAKDKAAALVARGQADADVVKLKNEAEVSGHRAAVKAFDGDGRLYAQHILFRKLAPAFQQIMANSSHGPLIELFEQFNKPVEKPAPTYPPTGVDAADKGATP